MNTFEIEMKVLLGEENNAIALIEKIHLHPETTLISQNNHLNHYFLTDGDLAKLEEVIHTLLVNPEDKEKLTHILQHGQKHSLRTRDVDGILLFVVKASADDTTSANGTARLEFESAIKDIDIHTLDHMILDQGFSFQSKWSRKRQEFQYKDMHVCIDKNAGYGYVAEFEKVISNADDIDQVKQSIRDEMATLGVEELDQGRLERMFAHYNQHWPEYYGTDKTFIME